ncbi:hypothetical protein [Photobacterium damselae]|uniref:hypothetical protein n=1 Tax=Photobacterium damselae TaxID=38293 RepID=UPI0015A36313|nr:hypothetical protein [Photobacterium damselae]NVO59617.1 hypothetical protein [Photobacterium damselae subsp. damselae]
MIDIASQENRVLLKENNGRKCFLAIHPRDDGSLELRDIETDTNFVFSLDQLESLINNGMFSVRDEEEALEHLKKIAPVLDENPAIQNAKTEQKRRLQYVHGALEANLPIGAPSKLITYIEMKSLELNDKKPPSAVSLYRWLKAYKESHSDEGSLLPSYQNSGNRNSKVPLEHSNFIDAVIRNHKSSIKVNEVYGNYLAQLELFNQERFEGSLGRFKPISQYSFRRRWRRAKENSA